MLKEFSGAGARRAAQKGQTSAWVQAFLRADGNNTALADGLLLEPRTWFGPLTWPLAALRRVCGPEEALRWTVPPAEWEPRVTALSQALLSGWDAPPLLVEVAGGAWTVSDGNHRHEAYRRSGASEAPVLFWATTAVDQELAEREVGPWTEVEALWREGQTSGRQTVVGALVRRADGRLFAQRRSPDRKTFPGCWDLVGGHVEPGESPRSALVRELREETGWALDRVLGLRRVVDWESPGPHGPVPKREFVFAVTVTGDPETPRLEAGKVTEGRWFGPGDLPLLGENRTGGDTYVHDLVAAEFAS